MPNGKHVWKNRNEWNYSYFRTTGRRFYWRQTIMNVSLQVRTPTETVFPPLALKRLYKVRSLVTVDRLFCSALQRSRWDGVYYIRKFTSALLSTLRQHFSVKAVWLQCWVNSYLWAIYYESFPRKLNLKRKQAS